MNIMCRIVFESKLYNKGHKLIVRKQYKFQIKNMWKCANVEKIDVPKHNK